MWLSHHGDGLPNSECTFFLVRLSLSVPCCAASFPRSQAVAHLPRVDAGALPGAAYEWPKNHAIYRRRAVAYWWPLLNRQPKWLPARNVSLENTAIRMRMSTESGSFLLPHTRPPGIYLDSQHGLVKPCIKWSHVKRLHMWCVYSLGWLGRNCPVTLLLRKTVAATIFLTHFVRIGSYIDSNCSVCDFSLFLRILNCVWSPFSTQILKERSTGMRVPVIKNRSLD